VHTVDHQDRDKISIEGEERELCVHALWASAGDVFNEQWKAYGPSIPIAMLKNQEIGIACGRRNAINRHNFNGPSRSAI
jgi:hypothetical protein